MPQTPHVEKHITASATVRDVVISMSDRLTVPLAPAVGMSVSDDSTALVITAPRTRRIGLGTVRARGLQRVRY
jgi:vacuolar iron transporter family protein